MGAAVIARVAHLFDPGCEACSPSQGSFAHLGAHEVRPDAPAPLANPEHPSGHWFHGTAFDPDDTEEPREPQDTDPGGRLEPQHHEPDEYGSNFSHWNTDLGTHFTSLHHVAAGFAEGGGNSTARRGKPLPLSRVAHASLHMANPKHFISEHDMTHEAIEHARSKGLMHLGADDQEDFYGRHDDMRAIDENGPSSEHPSDNEHWLAEHPDRDRVVESFANHLRSQGHDGITYGNAHEGPRGHRCAIAFEDTPVSMHQWEWLHPDRQQRTSSIYTVRLEHGRRRKDVEAPEHGPLTPAYLQHPVGVSHVRVHVPAYDEDGRQRGWSEMDNEARNTAVQMSSYPADMVTKADILHLEASLDTRDFSKDTDAHGDVDPALARDARAVRAPGRDAPSQGRPLLGDGALGHLAPRVALPAAGDPPTSRGIVEHPGLDADLDRLPDNQADAYYDRVRDLSTNLAHPSTHSLKGPLAGWLGTSLATNSYRMIHKLGEDGKVIVASVGVHDPAYALAVRRKKYFASLTPDPASHLPAVLYKGVSMRALGEIQNSGTLRPSDMGESGPGIYLTHDHEYAKRYAGMGYGGGAVLHVKHSIQHPLVRNLDDPDDPGERKYREIQQMTPGAMINTGGALGRALTEAGHDAVETSWRGRHEIAVHDPAKLQIMHVEHVDGEGNPQQARFTTAACGCIFDGPSFTGCEHLGVLGGAQAMAHIAVARKQARTAGLRPSEWRQPGDQMTRMHPAELMPHVGDFEPDDNLADSMREHGWNPSKGKRFLKQRGQLHEDDRPVTLWHTDQGSFVEPGNHRVPAANAAGLDSIPVLVKDRRTKTAHLDPRRCPCGMPVAWDPSNGWQHTDGSISHDGEFSDRSVSDLVGTTPPKQAHLDLHQAGREGGTSHDEPVDFGPHNDDPSLPTLFAGHQAGWVHVTPAANRASIEQQGLHGTGEHFNSNPGHVYLTTENGAEGWAHEIDRLRGGGAGDYSVFHVDTSKIPDWAFAGGSTITRGRTKGLTQGLVRNYPIPPEAVTHSHDIALRKQAHLDLHQVRVLNPTSGFDADLFDGEKLKPAVRAELIRRWTVFCARHGLQDWHSWAHLWFTGGEASEWSGPGSNPNGDFDMQVGVSVPEFVAAHPSWPGTQPEISQAFNDLFWTGINDHDFHPADSPRVFDLTFYQNPSVSSEIAVIHPYAAYDVLAETWSVHPAHYRQGPHLHAGVRKALQGAERYARQVLGLPEPQRTREAALLFTSWHTDRDAAFGPGGEGVFDYANLRMKALEASGLWQQLQDAANRLAPRAAIPA